MNCRWKRIHLIYLIVTHWEIKVFLRFSGELVSFRKLGQLDLYSTLSSLGLPMSTICPMEPAGVGVHPWTSKELNATLSWSI